MFKEQSKSILPSRKLFFSVLAASFTSYSITIFFLLIPVFLYFIGFQIINGTMLSLSEWVFFSFFTFAPITISVYLYKTNSHVRSVIRKKFLMKNYETDLDKYHIGGLFLIPVLSISCLFIIPLLFVSDILSNSIEAFLFTYVILLFATYYVVNYIYKNYIVSFLRQF